MRVQFLVEEQFYGKEILCVGAVLLRSSFVEEQFEPEELDANKQFYGGAFFCG